MEDGRRTSLHVQRITILDWANKSAPRSRQQRKHMMKKDMELPPFVSSAERKDIHKKLEKKISDFLGTDDTILYSSCFDANGGLLRQFLQQKMR